MVEKKVNVGIGEYYVVEGGDTTLESIGLGSCVGICLWDPNSKIGGLSHIMLGSSTKHHADVNPYRFADKALDAMVAEMIRKGAVKKSIKAKVFGGAELFQDQSGDRPAIGVANLRAVRELLDEYSIDITAEDTGGSHGRSIWFNTCDGRVLVKRAFGPTLEY